MGREEARPMFDVFFLYEGEDNKKKEFVRKNRYVGMKK